MPKEGTMEAESQTPESILADATLQSIALSRAMQDFARLNLRAHALNEDVVIEHEAFIQAIQTLISRAYNLNTIVAQELKFQELDAPRFYIFKTICKPDKLQFHLDNDEVPLDILFNAKPYFMLDHAVTELKNLRRKFDETVVPVGNSKEALALEEELFRVKDDFRQASSREKAKELIAAISELENRVAKSSGNIIHHHIYKYDPESHKYIAVNDIQIEQLNTRLSQVETE